METLLDIFNNRITIEQRFIMYINENTEYRVDAFIEALADSSRLLLKSQYGRSTFQPIVKSISNHLSLGLTDEQTNAIRCLIGGLHTGDKTDIDINTLKTIPKTFGRSILNRIVDGAIVLSCYVRERYLEGLNYIIQHENDQYYLLDLSYNNQVLMVKNCEVRSGEVDISLDQKIVIRNPDIYAEYKMEQLFVTHPELSEAYKAFKDGKPNPLLNKIYDKHKNGVKTLSSFGRTLLHKEYHSISQFGEYRESSRYRTTVITFTEFGGYLFNILPKYTVANKYNNVNLELRYVTRKYKKGLMLDQHSFFATINGKHVNARKNEYHEKLYITRELLNTIFNKELPIDPHDRYYMFTEFNEHLNRD